MEYAMLIEKESNGQFSATFPDLPGCFTQGETLGRLMLNAEDAVSTYLSGLRELGRPIPKPKYRTATVFVEAPGKKAG